VVHLRFVTGNSHKCMAGSALLWVGPHTGVNVLEKLTMTLVGTSFMDERAYLQ
jgi:hypothetical protein